MADLTGSGSGTRSDMTELMRRTIQANARFYKGWVDLSLEYFRGVTEIFSGIGDTRNDSGTTSATGQDAESVSGAGVIVVEGELNSAVRCAFLVTNDLPRKVQCELVATDFVDAGGKQTTLKVSFEPPLLQLAPGEQRVVSAVLVIDERLGAGVGYSGDFTIKGMDGFAVPVVVRRLNHSEGKSGSPIDHLVSDDVISKGTARPRSRKSSSGAKKRERKAR